MRVTFSPELDNVFKKIHKTDKSLVVKIETKLSLFRKNPKHPSLRTHKLEGILKNRWSISITRNYRLIYILEKENQAYFIDIGTHDEVYKK